MSLSENSTELILCPWQRDGDNITVSGQVTDPDGKAHTLWFRVPARMESTLTASADPFAIGFLFPCMHWGRPVHIRGTASPSLLANLELLSQVWHQRQPHLYQPILFFADEEQEPTRINSGDDGIACFSGGVDSCYTFWRHHQRLIGRRSLALQAGVIVHGFSDLPLDQPKAFQEASQHCKRMLDSVGVDTIAMATNAARDLPMPGRHTWSLAHGTTIGAILHLLSGRFHHGLIANSYPYTEIDNYYGTSPMTDHLMSSRSMEIQDDGGETTRTQKLAAIAKWPEAMANLRVCNKGTDGGNCCECEKCLRTILALRLHQETLPACFAKAVTDRQIGRVQIRYPNYFFLWQGIKNEAIAKGLGKAGWVRAIDTAIRRGRVRLARKRLLFLIRNLFVRNNKTK